MAGRQKYYEKSENCSQGHEKVWDVIGNPPPKEMGKLGSAGAQVRESAKKAVPG